MRQPAGLFWLASLLFLATLCSCAVDEEIVFEPTAEEFVIYPQGIGSSNQCPTLSRDARVLAWIRATGYEFGTRDRVVRWERPAPIDTLYFGGWPSGEIDEIDLSDDGRFLVGLAGSNDEPRFFMKCDDDGRVQRFVVPFDYTSVRGPRWVDENRIFFGALGPEGQGVWCWNPANDSITAVCVDFPNPQEQRRGDSPDLDRSGGMVCFETRRLGWRFRSLVCSVESGEVLLDVEGSIPRFWTITPEERDGLLYLDSHSFLRGVRLSRNETFYVLQEISEYDAVSYTHLTLPTN